MPEIGGLILHSAAFGVKGRALDTRIDGTRFHTFNESSWSAASNRNV